MSAAAARINRENRSQEELADVLARLTERYGHPADVPDGVWDCFLERCSEAVKATGREDVATEWRSIFREWPDNLEAD